MVDERFPWISATNAVSHRLKTPTKALQRQKVWYAAKLSRVSGEFWFGDVIKWREMKLKVT